MTIMNEIVGESGEAGEGCLTDLAVAAAVMVLSMLTALGLVALWAWVL